MATQIEYVEIRDESTAILGILDTFKSVIWHSVYYGVGDFEIYTPASQQALDWLKRDRYVTRPDNDEVGIIENINITKNTNDGMMITASGRFAKSILDRRIIYNLSGTSSSARVLSGTVELAVRTLVAENAISCDFDSNRNIPILELGEYQHNATRIVDEYGSAARLQVSNEELLSYTESLLEEYKMASRCVLNGTKLQYNVYQGTDRSVANAIGRPPVIFSHEYDNLTEGEYSYTGVEEKNVALIGGEGEGLERFYSVVGGSNKGLKRKEMWVDASSINKTYKDEDDTEQTFSDAEYKALLDAQGRQEMASMIAAEQYSGTIDISRGNYIYNRDFHIGDIVTIQDTAIGAFLNVRILEITEVQDENGYTVEANYQ